MASFPCFEVSVPAGHTHEISGAQRPSAYTQGSREVPAPPVFGVEDWGSCCSLGWPCPSLSLLEKTFGEDLLPRLGSCHPRQDVHVPEAPKPSSACPESVEPSLWRAGQRDSSSCPFSCPGREGFARPPVPWRQALLTTSKAVCSSHPPATQQALKEARRQITESQSTEGPGDHSCCWKCFPGSKPLD